MTLSNQILSDITIFNKYSRYLPDKKRRETWGEICDRYQDLMVYTYPKLMTSIMSHMDFIRSKKVLPSMRFLQFAGAPIVRNNSRGYNCAYLPIDDYLAFSETMFLLLGGTGVGYSVQQHHVDKLPEIIKPFKERKYLIGDSLEGWADAIKMLMKSYFGITKYKPRFDFSDIRPKGARLVTAGGKAPGPAPLRECLVKIENILDSKQNGDKLSPLECHDILCHIANSVLSGGIRRSAMIALFSYDDKEMLECKYGNWWETNEQRGRANNSVVLVKNLLTKDVFDDIINKIKLSNAGEPGIYITSDKEYGTNPCCEISLRPFSFCNLTEINAADIQHQGDFNMRAKVAAFFGTLQAGFTDFHYLRPIWKTNTEKDSLIGVGITGIASNTLVGLNHQEAVDIIKATNIEISNIIGINSAARCTTVKPSGSTSCVLGTSSGIHAWHNDYYIRRIRIMKNDPLYMYLYIYHPELLEDDKLRSHDTGIITIPQKAPKNSITRKEDLIDFLNRIKFYNENWVKAGHNKGPNTNNVSATISIKDLQWEDAGKWMWNNRNTYHGLSLLPFDGGSYTQAPFEDITEDIYNQMISILKEVDLTKIIEQDDGTAHSQEAACAGGTCSI